jgi:hypothetical protein
VRANIKAGSRQLVGGAGSVSLSVVVVGQCGRCSESRRSVGDRKFLLELIHYIIYLVVVVVVRVRYCVSIVDVSCQS